MTGPAEAWLLLFLLAAGLVAGAMASLAMGHLLGDAWVPPVRPALEAAVRAAPLLLPMALPVLLLVDRLYPWAGEGAAALDPVHAAWFSPWAFSARVLGALALWAALGRWLLRGPRDGNRPVRAGAALLVLVPSTGLALQDLALSRDAAWFGSLQGFALALGGAAAALAGAVLLTLLRRGLPREGRTVGLERALLTLGLSVLWIWFVQYVVVWAGNLPEEAAWYLRRTEGAWLLLKLGVAVPALLGAILLSLVPRWRAWRLGAVCALLLLQHAAQLAWVVLPAAPGARPAALADRAWGGPSPALAAGP